MRVQPLNLTLMLLLLISAASASTSPSVPFVSNGNLVVIVVVGDEAPVTDVMLGAEVAAYLRQYAINSASRIGRLASEVDITDGEVYVLIGLPANNPTVVQALGLQRGEGFDGPFLSLSGKIQVISGATQSDLETAVDLFITGTRNHGAVIRDGNNIDVQAEEEAVAALEPVEQPAEALADAIPEVGSEQPPAPTVEECETETFCKDGMLHTRNTDCREQLTKVCAHGCEEGVCRKNLFLRFLEWLMFWN
jgi:hypothetical protein